MTNSKKYTLAIGAVVIVALLVAVYWYVQNQQALQGSSKGVVNPDNLTKINTVGNPTTAASNASK